MTTQEKILDRINKLMSKTVDNGCTPEEAAAAAAMAQKLIAQHHIDMRDAGQEIDDDVVGCVEGYNKTWQATLANIIAKNTCCKVVVTGSGSSRKMAFIGRETDLQAVLALYDKLASICTAGIKAAKQEHKGQSSPARIETSYAIGFTNAISQEMGKQCRALQLITPEDVTEKVNEIFPYLRRSRSRSVQVHPGAYDQGRTDGQAAASRRALA